MTTIANNAIAPPGRKFRRSLASFLRAATTISYEVNDVVATAAASAIEFPNCNDGEGGGKITDVLIVIGDNVDVDVDLELLLFNAEPVSPVDAAPILVAAADAVKFVGAITLDTPIVTQADQTVYAVSFGAGRVFTTAGTSLYGILVARANIWANALDSAPIMISLGIELG